MIFFSNIGKQLAEQNINSQSEPLNTLMKNKNPQSMVMLPTDEEEVARLLRSLRSDCAMGWDNISSNLLKKHEFAIVPPLTYICNLALSTGKFPKVFKKAIVHPSLISFQFTRSLRVGMETVLITIGQ
ncbi:unnamed protein product [Euphydryas editha]|uniref:Uncharacterized protein n=1 Tax=Euphydryas editha TaxID=104508 RepID=A0AAU9TTH9_EUPED|nr:unnamed protein product [Euphydryas editha]